MLLSIVTIFGLFAFSAAYHYESSGYIGNIESRLASVDLSIKSLLERQRAQEASIYSLIDSSSKNLGFQHEFYDVASEDVKNEIAVQNKRFARLEHRIAQIRSLKSEVGKLQHEAKVIEALVNKTDARDIYTLDRLTDLAENDFPEAQDIIEAAIEANRIQRGLEAVVNRIEDSSRLLNIIEYGIDQISTTLNYTSAAAYERVLNLKNGVAEENIKSPRYYRDVGVFVTGFDLSRQKRKYQKSAVSAHLGFDVTADYFKDIEVNAYDLSSQGWYTNSVSVSATGYTYTDERLDIRYPFQTQY